MFPRRLRAPFALAPLALALTACSSSSPSDAGLDASPFAEPPMVCRSGAGWDPSQHAFRSDGTADWGLADARGVMLATGDLDNDGYPDLVVMQLAYNTRTNLDATPPVLTTQLYMNRPRDGQPGRRFVDATRASNFLALRDESGYGRSVTQTTFADVDNDGDLDAVTGVYVNTASGAPPDPGDRTELLLNDGHGVFALAPPLPDPSDANAPQTTNVIFTDQNRDGNLDAYVAYFYDPTSRLEIGQQQQLFRGHGDGTFEDVTDAVGLTLDNTMASFATDGHRRALYGATACDVNGDGLQDLIGAAYGRQWNLLYVNDGERYHEVGRAAGVAGDMNTDYHDDQSYLCYCQAHPGMCPAGTPAPVYQCLLRGWTPGYNDQPWRLNGNTFSIVCGDVDNDGDMDLYTAEIAHPDVGSSSDRSELLRNDSQNAASDGTGVTFTRPGRVPTGLVPGSPASLDEGGLSAAMFDFDGDGRLDIYLGASDYPGQYSWLFHQKPDGTFEEVGIPAGFHHACPHGLALADFDRDGDVDIIVGSSTARDCAQRWPNGPELRVYENTASDANWTSIALVGRGAGGANRTALGARVRVTAGGVTQTREVQGSFGHYDLSSEPVVHFGLAGACTIDQLEVRWPDAAGTVETFTNVRANYALEIRQGEGHVRYPH